jgi:hypothetical protein
VGTMVNNEVCYICHCGQQHSFQKSFIYSFCGGIKNVSKIKEGYQ